MSDHFLESSGAFKAEKQTAARSPWYFDHQHPLNPLHFNSLSTSPALTRFLASSPQVPVVGVGSTPTCSNPPAALPGVTEMHPGNYIYYDTMQQVLLGWRRLGFSKKWEIGHPKSRDFHFCDENHQPDPSWGHDSKHLLWWYIWLDVMRESYDTGYFSLCFMVNLMGKIW